MGEIGLIDYAIHLLASGTAEEWRRAKNDYDRLSAVIFDWVDVDSSGSVDKQELCEALKHGRVSVSRSDIIDLSMFLSLPTARIYCDMLASRSVRVQPVTSLLT